MQIDPHTFTIQDYLGKTFACPCGKPHTTALAEVCIEPNAMEKLPAFCKRHGVRSALVVSDLNTAPLAGENVERLLAEAGLQTQTYCYPFEELVPDEAAVGRLVIALQPQTDLIVAVGTGTINDLCKFVSFKTQKPYCIVATAPSMDGFASVGAPLIVDHLKTTYDAHVPLGIFGDTLLLSRAPMPMIMAGVADILGKYSCLVDWQMAHLINGEYYCETIVEMVCVSIAQVTENLDKLQTRDPETIGKIMEALVLTGIAMSFVGNSRPASGSEHHVSHYWEMMFLFAGKKAVLHGTKVGIGTVAMAQLYQWLWETEIDFDAARENARGFSFDAWAQTIRRTYQSAADGVLALERQTGKNSPENVLPRIDAIQRQFETMKAFGQKWLPKSEEIRAMLSRYGAPVNPHEVGISSQQIEDGVVVAKELRNRYGLLQILFDLGLLQPFAERLTRYFEVE